MSSNRFFIPSVEVNLDKPRKLMYDFNALILIEEYTGQKLVNRPKGSEDWTPSTKDIRTLIWAGLIAEDPELTELEVGRLMTAENLPILTLAMNEAVKLALGKKKEGAPPLAPVVEIPIAQ